MEGFMIVWAERELLFTGFVNTLLLTVVASVSALLLGALFYLLARQRYRVIRWPIHFLVDGMRCTPFLLFAYVIYYGLPVLGITLSSWQAGFVALSIYHSAYLCEVVRGAVNALPKEPIESGNAFGFHGFSKFRHIVLPPLLLSSGPMIGNQCILIVKDTALLSIITLPELTHAATSIQTRFYVPFAAFIAAVALYWIVCLAIETGVGEINRRAEQTR